VIEIDQIKGKQVVDVMTRLAVLRGRLVPSESTTDPSSSRKRPPAVEL
jgi:hypothetical protein